MKENFDQDFKGFAYLTALIEVCPSAANVESYAKIVYETFVRRQVIKESEQNIRDAYADDCNAASLLNQAERRIVDISKTRAAVDYTTSATLIKNQRDRVLNAINNPGSEMGLETGLKLFDENRGGLRPGDLMVIAARPSMGKTAMVSKISYESTLITNKPCFTYTIETKDDGWMDRMVCAQSKVERRDLMRGVLRDDEWQQVNAIQDTIAKMPLYFVDKNGITIEEIRDSAEKMRAKHGAPGLIVVDYIQIVKTKFRYTEERLRVQEIVESLKNLARSMDCPVIALSQLSRAVEQRTPPRPMLSDLRESGAIEAEADVVAFLYRPSYYAKKEMDEGRSTSINQNDPDEFIIGKDRDGPTYTLPIRFRPEYATFENYTQEN